MNLFQLTVLLSVASVGSAQVDWLPTGGRSGHTIAESGNGILLAGGLNGSLATLDDTWEMTSSVWVPRSGTTGRLPALYGHAMASASNGRVVVFGGASAVNTRPVRADVWVWTGNNWTLETPVGPSPRIYHAMAFDPRQNRVVLFGGFDGTSALGDTWILDMSAQPLRWQQYTSSTTPQARHGHVMAYDASRQRVVMTCGSNRFNAAMGALFNDHWEWDGTTWSNRGNSSGPALWRPAMAFDSVRGQLVVVAGFRNTQVDARPEPATYVNGGSGWSSQSAWDFPDPRGGHAVAFHPTRGTLILYGGTARIDGSAARSDTWEWDGTRWSRLTTNLSPNERTAPAMCWDNGAQRATVFGGDGTATFLRDTWTWTGREWVEHTPTVSPPARAQASLVFDAARQRSVLFGGVAGSTLFTDTWTWNGAVWSQSSPTTRPSARAGHAMVFDSVRNRVTLFGGGDTLAQLADTWDWDGLNWTQRTPWNAPAPRRDHAMAFDPVRGRVVLFGGRTGTTNLGDTWEWNGTNWAVRVSATPSPAARSGHNMVYDTQRARVVLFGGVSANDTWEWDGVRWSQRAPIHEPSPRTGHGMAFDAARNRTVIFGGTVNGNRSSELWEYAAANGPSSYTGYGDGCLGTAGVPAIDAAALPWIGETLVIELTAVLEPVGALLLLGLGPVDIDVTALGMPGCRLRSSAEIWLPFSRLDPRRYVCGLPIPLEPSLVGGQFFTQALVLDPLANPAGLTLSNARRGVMDIR